MSSIAFNTEKYETVYLRGPERYHMAGIVHRMMMLAVQNWTPALIVEHGSADHYITRSARDAVQSEGSAQGYTLRKRFDEALETYIRVGELSADGTLFEGRDLFVASLNTAISMGCAPIQLAARIHGQCEVHLWIADSDTAAIAEVIEQGRSLGLYRADMGWEAVIELLRRDDTGDVVLSFSVCDSFPNSYIAIDDRLPTDDYDWSKSSEWDSATREAAENVNDDRSDIWYKELTDADRWTAAMRGLQKAGVGLRLEPSDLDGKFRFGNGETGFSILGGAA